jgi:hypothetical protein
MGSFPLPPETQKVVKTTALHEWMDHREEPEFPRILQYCVCREAEGRILKYKWTTCTYTGQTLALSFHWTK